MSPAFAAGDRLLVVPVSDIEAGQIVAVRDPRDLRRVLVKRVRAAGPDGVDLRGDNEAASTDSRQFGPVPPANIVGRVVYRYFPPERSGWIGE
jgi:nickel-type superoxide dismutase maturation protease